MSHWHWGSALGPHSANPWLQVRALEPVSVNEGSLHGDGSFWSARGDLAHSISVELDCRKGRGTDAK